MKIRDIPKSRTYKYLMIALFAVGYALICEIFVFPNDFAPAGINGLATMVQYAFDFQVGYLSLIINLPMLAVAFFVLNRKYACRTLTFTLAFSAALLLLDQIDLSPIIFKAEDTGGALLAAIAAGLFNGAIYSLSVRMGGSTGGTDVVAAFINHKYPEFDTIWIIFSLNVTVAGLSFFVYGMDYRAVILCAVYVFVSSRTSDAIFKGGRSAAKFEIITEHSAEIAEELMQKLHHGCTVVRAEGMYTHTEKSMLVCVVNRRQVVEFERIIRKYDHTFAYISTVNGTIGKFARERKKPHTVGEEPDTKE